MKHLHLLIPLIGVVSCSPIPVPAIFSTPVSSSDHSTSTAIFQEVNEYRRTKGKAPLARHSGLDQLALQHSEDMRRKRGGGSPKTIVNHDGFGYRFSIAQNKYNFGNLHENVAVAPRGSSIVQTWIHSRGHEPAMRSAWSCTGVGAVVDSDGTVFATQLFGNFAIDRSKLQNRGPLF
jgi:uncharacterized protein YkwD